MNTQRMATLRHRMNRENLKWEAVVINDENGFQIETPFHSGEQNLKNVLHKIELDLMTNLSYGFENPIHVAIRKIPD